MKSTTFYVLNNWCEVYNIYSTREKAEKARDLLIKQYMDKIRDNYDEFTNAKNPRSYFNPQNRYFIFEVKEGEGFGEEALVNGMSDVKV